MRAHSIRNLLSLVMLLTATSLGANSMLFPRSPDCDPSKATCVHASEQKACEATNCFSTLSAQSEHEEQNNCIFKCNDTITEIPTAVLRRIFSAATGARLSVIAAQLNAALQNISVKGMIDTKRKLAHLLAQIRRLEEPVQLLSSATQRSRSLWKKTRTSGRSGSDRQSRLCEPYRQ